MASAAPKLTQPSPRSPTLEPSSVKFEGRDYPLLWEPAGWRLRSRSAKHPANFRTGTTNLKEAQRRSREWLEKKKDDPITSRKGGGTLEGLCQRYLVHPKKTKQNVADDNVSRLRTVCRVALGKELAEVTCREVGPELWEAYQRAALAAKGRAFDLVTRYRENIAINSAVRAARTIFLPALRKKYTEDGFSARPDAGAATLLPEPYVPPTPVDDDAMVKAWRELPRAALWVVIGLARFSGMRREEITCARVGWIEEKDGVVTIWMRDRTEEEFWTKTGRPYHAQVIDPEFAEWLMALRATKPRDALLVGDPEDGGDREDWMEKAPQKWLRKLGSKAGKPLHRLRGLYADHIAKLTADAVTARLAGIRAAQNALGHTTASTTKDHYLSEDALR